MLIQLSLENFKSWRSTGPIKLASVTAFFGANSSGKTSILQSLLMLRQTVEDPDRNQVLTLNGIADLGTYQDIIYAHNQDDPLGIHLEWISDSPIEVVDLVQRARKKSSVVTKSDHFSIDAHIEIRPTAASVVDISYTIGDSSFRLDRKKDDKYELSSEDWDFVRNPGRPWPLPRPTKFYGFPDEVRLYYQNASFLSDLELQFENSCKKIRYLGPLREDPRRQYIFTGGAPQDVGRRGELAISALVSSSASNRKISRGWNRNHSRRLKSIPLEQVVAEWLKELGLIESFEVEKLDDRGTLFRVAVRRTTSSTPVMLTDVGFGVSQVLPVLVLLAYAEPGDTVILEQPEIHLHPAVQARLADIILEAALAREIQVLVESHSEHLLTRLQRRIAEQDFSNGLRVSAEDVAIYFCSQSNDESELRELQLDLFGNITNWPEEFFGDPMKDRLAMLEAALRREGGRSAS